jgi:hypothetical protein
MRPQFFASACGGSLLHFLEVSPSAIRTAKPSQPTFAATNASNNTNVQARNSATNDNQEWRMKRQIKVPEPCTSNWEAMPGSNRWRYCAKCNRHVYNFSEMTIAEVERLISESTGRVCARIIQREDGTIETRIIDKRTPWKIPSAIPRIAGAALTALLTTGIAKPATATLGQEAGLVQIANAQVAKAALAIQVEDVSGAVVSNAHVTIVSKETLARIERATDTQGALLLNDLPAGNYDVTAALSRFVTTTKSVTIPASEPLRFRLDVVRGNMVFVGEIASVRVEPTHSRPSEGLVGPNETQNPPHQNGPIHKFFHKVGRIFSS